MESLNGRIPEEYLESKLENPDLRPEAEELQLELQEPYASAETEANPFQAEGENTFGDEFIQEKIGHKPLDVDSLDDPWQRHRFRKENWQELTTLTLSATADQEKNIDIAAMAPDYRIFFKPEGDSSDAQADAINRQIIINGPLNSPNSLLALLHEIGHTQDMKARGMDHEEYTAGRSAFNELPSAEDMAHIMTTERNAWAFALKQVRPFLNENDPRFNRQTVLNVIHNYYLNSYSEKARKVLEGQLTKDLDLAA